MIAGQCGTLGNSLYVCGVLRTFGIAQKYTRVVLTARFVSTTNLNNTEGAEAPQLRVSTLVNYQTTPGGLPFAVFGFCKGWALLSDAGCHKFAVEV